MALILFDFFLCLVWLPIGASKTYGFRTAHEAFLTTNNGTGAVPGWNWMLSFLFAAGAQGVSDASAHIAEETKNARKVAGINIVKSTVVSSIIAFIVMIIFLFCTPSLDAILSLNAPQPFVLIYRESLGRGGCVFMTLLAVIEIFFTIAVMILAGSRLIYAIARDGALPFSSWVGKVNPDGRPVNAVTFMYGFSALLLCTMLPSSSAFTSIISVAALPFFASYGLIALLRLVFTPNGFRNSLFPLGKYRKALYAISAVYHAVLIGVFVSPFTFPVTVATMNFGGIVFVAVTIFGILSYWFLPEDKWLSREQLKLMYEYADTVPES